MHVLFVTLEHRESDFYGRVGRDLERRGHTVAHLCVSRLAARRLRRHGKAWSVHDIEQQRSTVSASELRATNGLWSLRSLYRADPACRGRSEGWCLARAARTLDAVSEVFDEFRPDLLVPEVGNETIRTAAIAVARARGIPALFLLHTIFPRPLRLVVDELQQPVVPIEDLRPLAADEQDEVDAFVRAFVQRAAPIRPYIRPDLSASKLRDFARHVAVKVTIDRDNEYLRPDRTPLRWYRTRRGAAAASRHYRPVPNGPFVYFPLHVADDYKIRGVIPHCRDQASLIELVADALPDGMTLVVKEHPMAIGREPDLLARIAAIRNVVVVAPETNTHDLIRAATFVAVIGSTVGLEALLHEKAVLTLGQPHYAGYGLTVDVDSFRDIAAGVRTALAYAPERVRRDQFLHAVMRSCRPGSPAGVDRSDANAQALAGSIAAYAAGLLAARAEATP